jgi:hypothetical protein
VGEPLVSDLQHDTFRDEQAVIRTMNRYSRALDYGLAEEWLDVFTADARYETVLPDGTQYCLLTTREDFVRYLADYPHPPEHRQKHMLINPVIEVNGDDALGDSGWLFLRSDTGGSRPRLSAFGRYRDRFERVQGVWRIADRVCETEAMDAE